MKKIIMIYFLLSLCFSCSTSPYIKKSDLPKNITYYSTKQQFKINPEWYWRLRPENTPIDDEMINQLKNYDTNILSF